MSSSSLVSRVNDRIKKHYNISFYLHKYKIINKKKLKEKLRKR